jgi:hypothetical protein
VTIRAAIGVVNIEAAAVAEAFAAGLQAGHDQRDAEVLNRQFAADVIWGSPYGALVEGYERLHPIHIRFQQQPATEVEFRYRVRHALAVSEDVIVAHIARLAISPDGKAVLRNGHVRAGPPRWPLVASRGAEHSHEARRGVPANS